MLAIPTPQPLLPSPIRYPAPAPPLCRENVLLGRRYDAVRYQAVLHACALLPDLREMPAGDQTLGEPRSCPEAAWAAWGLTASPGTSCQHSPLHAPEVKRARCWLCSFVQRFARLPCLPYVPLLIQQRAACH
jgi:hypothetical protein